MTVFLYVKKKIVLFFCPSRENASDAKTKVYLGILSLFCTYAQAKFPYHIDKVESNDSLYGGEASYMQELLVFIDKLVEEILSQLAMIGEKGDITVRAVFSFVCSVYFLCMCVRPSLPLRLRFLTVARDTEPQAARFPGPRAGQFAARVCANEPYVGDIGGQIVWVGQEEQRGGRCLCCQYAEPRGG
jgi:hypothetical protein